MQIRLMTISFVLFAYSLPAIAQQTTWAHECTSNLEGDNSMGRIYTSWASGEKFQFFYFPDEGEFGITLTNPSWRLQAAAGQHVVASFSRSEEIAIPISPTSADTAQGFIAPSQVRDFVVLLRNHWVMRLRFPRGDDWQIDLNGVLEPLRNMSGCLKFIKEFVRPNINPF